MKFNVTVRVPYNRKLSYTLYAKGFLISIPTFEENEDFVKFTFLGGTVFILFYTFDKFRRAYIATGWESPKGGEAVILPGIEEKLCIIYTARGEKIDILKRVLHILTDEQGEEYKIFKLPLLFWYRLSFLIQQSKASRSDLQVLWESFTGTKLIKRSSIEIYNDKKRQKYENY